MDITKVYGTFISGSSPDGCANMKYSASFETPVGVMTIVECDGAIVGVMFGEKKIGENKRTKIIGQAISQLTEYFSKKRKNFDLPISFNGTMFQKRVWEELLKIPYGETRTYKELAAAIGNPKAVRAVGGANNKNSLAIIVPCHRVIGSGGALVGYADGIEIKAKLLELESTPSPFPYLS